jgi:hypothetical protein
MPGFNSCCFMSVVFHVASVETGKPIMPVIMYREICSAMTDGVCELENFQNFIFNIFYGILLFCC